MNSRVSSPDMSSIEVLNTDDESGSSSSNGFCTLSCPEQPIQNGDADNQFHGNLNRTNMHSGSTLYSSIDIQDLLSELVLENFRLKEKVSESNSLMKKQLVKLQSWQNDILTSKCQLEENLRKANEKIALLEKQNADLLEKDSKLMEYEQNGKACRKCTKLDTDLTALLGMDYCLENQHLIMGWYYFNESLSENLKVICRNLEALKSSSNFNTEEKYTLECYILMLQFKIAFLEGSDMPSQADLSLKTDEETGYEVVCSKKTNEVGKIIQELTEKLQEKDIQLASLLKEKEEYIEMAKESEFRSNEIQKILNMQYDGMADKLKTESELTQRYRERCDNFERLIEKYERKLEEKEAILSDINASKQDDGVQQKGREKEKLQNTSQLENSFSKKLCIATEKCENLQVDDDEASQLLEIQLKEKNEKLASLLKEKEEYIEMVKVSELRSEEIHKILNMQFDEMMDKLKTESDLTQRYKERCNNLEHLIENYEKKLEEKEAIISDINASKQHDGVQQKGSETQKLQNTVHIEKIIKLAKATEKYEKLQVHCEVATQLLEIQQKESEKLASCACATDVKKYMEEADHQTARLFATQEQLMDVTGKMKRLQREIEEMKDSKNKISSYKKDNPELKRQAIEELERMKNQWKGSGNSSP